MRSPDLKAPGSTTLVLALLVLACGAAGHDVQEQPPCVVTATWGITSGLQPPGFEMGDPEDLQRLRELIEGLPETEPREEPQFGSFSLQADEARCRFPARVVVFDGAIKATTANGTTRFFKDAKGLEKFLSEEVDTRGVLDGFIGLNGFEPRP